MRSEPIPRPFALLAVLAAALFLLPLAGLLVRFPWAEAVGALTSPEILTAAGLSLVTSLSATALSILLGVPLAMVYARAQFPGLRVVRALTTLPMVLPPVVGGVALLVAFGRRGIVGQFLDSSFGIRIPFTTTAAVLAATFVAMPFLVLTVQAGLRSMDRRYEEAARSLGAGRWMVFRRVTLPLVAPSLYAGATITFAGNVPGSTQTLPLAVYLALETRPEAAIALSLVLLLLSLVVLVALRDRYLPTS